jgi:Tfp pilus assembly protein PilF
VTARQPSAATVQDEVHRYVRVRQEMAHDDFKAHDAWTEFTEQFKRPSGLMLEDAFELRQLLGHVRQRRQGYEAQLKRHYPAAWESYVAETAGASAVKDPSRRDQR